MSGLERALAANRDEIQRELAKAEVELRELQGREQALAATIARARLALGDTSSRPPLEAKQSQSLTLHEGIVEVLRAGGNRPLTAGELADQVNIQRLYRRKDGAPVDGGQVHARVQAYPRLFVREGGRIRLRAEVESNHDPNLLERFDQAMLEVYDAALREVGYAARRFLFMIRRRGGLEAAQHLLAKAGVSDGFGRLASAHKLSLSMEFQVLRPEFASLFSQEERETARSRLLDHGLVERDLP